MSQKIKTSVEIDGSLTASQIANATTDTDKFLVSDGGTVKYRTGAELASDLGIASGSTSKVQHQVKAGVAINKGQAVYVTSADGTNVIVGLASNASEATSSKTMGLLNATVAANGFADVIAEGLLDGLNTSAATVGDPVWLGTSGNLIYGLANKPYAPNHLVFIGIVTRVNANNGEIFVKVQNGFELDEIHDVDLKTTTKVNGHLLGYNGSLWVNKTIAEWLGYTPYNASNPAGYISSYTETDTLATVTSRGNVANYNIALGTNAAISGGGSAKWITTDGTTSYGGGLVSSVAGSAKAYYYFDGTNAVIQGAAGIGISFQPNNSSQATLNTSGDFTANASLRSPIFYDLNDTSFYTDPASTSNLNKLRITSAGNSAGGNILMGPAGEGSSKWSYLTGTHYNATSQSKGVSIIGLYASASENAISIGGNIYEANPATEIRFYTHNAITHGTGGSVRMVINSAGNVEANVDMRAPIFYDSNDTTYYGDFNSTTRQYQAISFGDSTRYSAINTTINGSGAGDKLILYGGTFNYDARLLVGADYDMLFKSQGNSAGKGSFKFYSGQNCNLAMTIDGSQYTSLTGGLSVAGNSSWFGGYGASSGLAFENQSSFARVVFWNLDFYEWDSGQIMTMNNGYVQANNSFRAPIFYDSNDTGFYLDPNSTTTSLVVAGAMKQNNTLARPSVQWGQSGNVTGAVVIKLPGTSPGNYGMIHAVIDIYEYNANNVCTVIVGGHNWSTQWHNLGAQVIGKTNKQVRLAVKDGKYCIVLGDGSSVWEYGQVVLRKIQNGTYYNGTMDLGGAYSIGIESDSYSWVSSDLRRLDSQIIIASSQTQAPIYYDYNDTAYYVDPNSNSSLNTATFAGRVKYSNYIVSNDRGGMMGDYNITGTASKCIWTIGESWPLGNMYGLAYEYDGTYYHHLALKENGTTYARLGFGPAGAYFHGAITSGTSSYSPIYYDSNDTAYYINPADGDVSAVLKGTVTIGGGTGGNYDEGLRIIDSGSFSVITFGATGNAGAGRYQWLKNSSDIFELRNVNGSQIWNANQNGDITANYIAYAGASMRAPIFYDSNNTGYYVDPASSSSLNTANIGVLTFRGVGGDSGVGSIGDMYGIYQQGGAWNYPFPDLCIGYHTGIKIGAYYSYNGTRFYNNSDWATITASVNDGDNNFRGYYDVIAYASDRRLKHKVKPIEDALSKVKSLTGMTYQWNEIGKDHGWDPDTEVREAGVFAQDVQAVLPEAVRLAPFDDEHGVSRSGENFLTVKYDKIVPLLIEAIKEQQTQIEELKELINKLINK